MLVDTETPLLTKILEIVAENSQATTGAIVPKLRIEVVAPERSGSPGGGQYCINIAQDVAKELAGRITNFFERGSS